MSRTLSVCFILYLICLPGCLRQAPVGGEAPDEAISVDMGDAQVEVEAGQPDASVEEMPRQDMVMEPQRCVPQSERCNGALRQICDVAGLQWDELACPSGQTCQSVDGVEGCFTSEVCGDGKVEGSEACDEERGECSYNQVTCMACVDCQWAEIFGPYCGDEVTNGPEGCDGEAWCTERCVDERPDCARTEEGCPIEWVTVPEGLLGADYLGGQPVAVPIARFQISKTEVTVEQYQACVDASACTPSNVGEHCNAYIEGRSLHPVNCVDWGQARTFAKWLGADVDLPTEAQWQYAAEGGESYLYSGSNDPDEIAWYEENSFGSTHFVGTKQANGYGLHDMSGNLYEWVRDAYEMDRIDYPANGETSVGVLPPCRPACETGVTSVERVVRGGSFMYYEELLEVTNRGYYEPQGRTFDLGFRISRPAP